MANPAHLDHWDPCCLTSAWSNWVVDINEDQSTENKGKLFIQSLLVQGSQPHHLHFGWDPQAGGAVVELYSGRTGGLALPWWRLLAGAGIGGLTRRGRPSDPSGVSIWLPPAGSKLETETKIKELVSYQSSWPFWVSCYKGYGLSFGSLLRQLSDFLQVWLTAGWPPELFSGGTRLVSWASGY